MENIGTALALAVLIFAAPAVAEEAARATPIAAPQIIAAAGAADLFTPLPSAHGVRVRHAASGLVCSFDALGGRILVFPGLPRGEDVGCDRAGQYEAATLYATRYPQTLSLDEHVRNAIGSIHARFPNAQPLSPSAAADQNASRTARFLINDEAGARRYTRVSLASVDGWVIKMRYTATIADDTALAAAEAASDQLWTETLASVAAARST